MNEIRQLGRRWVKAEQDGDVAALDAITVGTFTLVGPLGFVLDKDQWLDRYRTGQLVTSSLVWDDVHVREYGDAAVAIGRHTQQATYRGQPSDGQFRATHVIVKVNERWQFAGMQLSPIGQFSPPSAG
jgi:ketosteroid isomerase-like protein